MVKIKEQKSTALDSLKQQETVLSQVKVNVVFRFISDVRAEVSAHKAMPISIVFTIKLILEMGRHLLSRMHFI
jgi:hypothetical protein